MALSSRARPSMYDENTIHAGKVPVVGVQGSKGGANGNQVIGKSTGGLKQQSTTSERRILSDISNTKAPSLSSFGTPKPSPKSTGGLKQQSTTSERRILSDISNTKAASVSSYGTPKPSPKPGFVPFRESQTTKADNVFKSENLPPKAGFPQSSQKAGVRIPLRNIVNESKENGAEIVQQKPKLKSGAPKMLGSKATSRIRLTDEQLRLADEWAKEGIERIHFSGDDMEALRQKMIEAEIEETVALVRNYRGCAFPPAVVKSSDMVEDVLRTGDGLLKLDTEFEEAVYSVADNYEYFKAEDDSQMEDPILNAMNNSLSLEEEYPSIF